MCFFAPIVGSDYYQWCFLHINVLLLLIVWRPLQNLRNERKAATTVLLPVIPATPSPLPPRIEGAPQGSTIGSTPRSVLCFAAAAAGRNRKMPQSHPRAEDLGMVWASGQPLLHVLRDHER